MQRRWAPQLSSRSIEHISIQPVGGQPSTGALLPKDRSARRQREDRGQNGSGARLEAAVLLYLALIWPSARFVPRRGLRASQIELRLVSQRACDGETSTAGTARVEQRAGAPHSTASTASTPGIHSERLRGTLSRTTVAVPVRLIALQMLGALAQPNQLRPAVVAVLLKGSGSSPQNQSQRACPWVMSLLARAPPSALSTEPFLPTPTPACPASCRSSLPLCLCQMLFPAALR